MADESTRNQRIGLEQARWILWKVWSWGAVTLAALVIAQLIFGRFEGFAPEFVAWFMPTIVPTVGLILGVITSTAHEDDSGRTVKTSFYRVARGLSVTYLVLLLLTMLLEPFAWIHDIEYYNFSNYWLGPIQGFVVGALGALFNSRKMTNNNTAALREEQQNER